ncbi:hypothetical protein N8K70_03915 [Microbacterium betulae]|uniref:Uncharacterized protein n=1 Tax=Microbacterium betulae TaxID=2981139 RepID=A0AA97I7P1_9MICO|nr:hypothetical protein [Microbacterium sp. AB]WOF23837.1 hypothetical protein N8K70_03915 [Microbacterium sp. AB]
MTDHITNVFAVVRVDGQPVKVAPSTRLPDGVDDIEIARLLRFGVIREDDTATTPDEPAADAAALADGTVGVEVVATASKRVSRKVTKTEE